jgi:hypothetical protein
MGLPFLIYMIAQIALITNWKEIQKIEDLMGLEPPKEIYEYKTFGFNIDDVNMFHLDNDNLIVLFFSDRTYSIKYEESIYQKLMCKFNE